MKRVFNFQSCFLVVSLCFMVITFCFCTITSSKSEGIWRTPSSSRKTWVVMTMLQILEAVLLRHWSCTQQQAQCFCWKSISSSSDFATLCDFMSFWSVCIASGFNLNLRFHSRPHFACSRVGFCHFTAPNPRLVISNRFMTFHVQWHWFLHRCNLRVAIHN